jgi:hypothetical protein
MPDVDAVSSEKNDEKDHQICDLEELKSYKYLLGDFGISMLKAISQGAEDGDAIMMLSGVPAACITGRIPVLNNLRLIDPIQAEKQKYFITTKGLQFLKCIHEI